jgi:hypothetical protein
MHWRDEYNIFARVPEGKRSLVRFRHRWEGGIKMDLKEIGWECVD